MASRVSRSTSKTCRVRPWRAWAQPSKPVLSNARTSESSSIGKCFLGARKRFCTFAMTLVSRGFLAGWMSADVLSVVHSLKVDVRGGFVGGGQAAIQCRGYRRHAKHSAAACYDCISYKLCAGVQYLHTGELFYSG